MKKESDRRPINHCQLLNRGQFLVKLKFTLPKLSEYLKKKKKIFKNYRMQVQEENASYITYNYYIHA